MIKSYKNFIFIINKQFLSYQEVSFGVDKPFDAMACEKKMAQSYCIQLAEVEEGEKTIILRQYDFLNTNNRVSHTGYYTWVPVFDQQDACSANIKLNLH